MRICVVAYKFGTEEEIGHHLGTYHYFIEKMRTLVRQGHEVYVVSPWVSFSRKGSTAVDGVRIIRYWPPMLAISWLWPLNRLVRSIYFAQTRRVTLQTVRRHQCEIVYVWQARETGYAIAMIKEKLGVPFFFRQITAWHWHFERRPKDIFGNRSWYQRMSAVGLGRLLDRALQFILETKKQRKFADVIYGKADRIVFLSNAAIKEAQLLGLDPQKASVLGVGIESDIFKPLDDQRAIRNELGIVGERVLLFIGRINFAEKGIGYLLEAMPSLKALVPGVNLVIIGGGGESERMRKTIDELKINDCVQVVGKKPFHELVKYINAADVMVVPSVWMEAFGQVTIEGMSCAVPVVTSDAGASPEINIDGVTGYVVPAKNSQAIADAVKKILMDPALQKRLGQAARARVVENYTYEALTKKFLEIIKT